MSYYKIGVYIWICCAGACIGSFLNVVIYRLPQKNFFTQTRSHCPMCAQKLNWLDIIPIFSYIFILRARCRYCKSAISPRYPIIEAAGTILAVFCFARFGMDWRTVISFGVSAILLAIALIDLDTMEIPDSLIIAIIPFALCAIWGWSEVTIADRIIGFFMVSLPLLLLTVAIDQAFGGGDIKLMAICGFLLGWKNIMLAFFIALLFGGGYAIYLLLSRKSERGTHIAFAPYLCAGIFAAMLWGGEIIDFYLNLFM